MEGEESGGNSSKLRVIGQVFMLCLGLGGGCVQVCLGNVETIDGKVQCACSVNLRVEMTTMSRPQLPCQIYLHPRCHSSVSICGMR